MTRQPRFFLMIALSFVLIVPLVGGGQEVRPGEGIGVHEAQPFAARQSGMYRITANHPDYWPYISPDIVVMDAPMRLNIPLVLTRRVYLPIILRNP